MSHGLKRTLVTVVLTLGALLLRPAPARADLTAFWGISPTPATHQTHGFSIGANASVFGAEFEWGNTSEKTSSAAPALRTYMFNGMLITPGRKFQVYLAAGWGRYRETLSASQETGSVTNVGVGVKVKLLGPIKLRLDYRTFSLRGTPIIRNPKRFYAGITLGI